MRNPCFRFQSIVFLVPSATSTLKHKSALGIVYGTSTAVLSFEGVATNALFRDVRVRAHFELSVCKTEGVWVETTAGLYSDVVTWNRSIERLAWRLYRGTSSGGQWETVKGNCISKCHVVWFLVLLLRAESHGTETEVAFPQSCSLYDTPDCSRCLLNQHNQ